MKAYLKEKLEEYKGNFNKYTVGEINELIEEGIITKQDVVEFYMGNPKVQNKFK